jgi:hypothetical protein
MKREGKGKDKREREEEVLVLNKFESTMSEIWGIIHTLTSPRKTQ